MLVCILMERLSLRHVWKMQNASIDHALNSRMLAISLDIISFNCRRSSIDIMKIRTSETHIFLLVSCINVVFLKNQPYFRQVKFSPFVSVHRCFIHLKGIQYILSFPNKKLSYSNLAPFALFACLSGIRQFILQKSRIKLYIRNARLY